LSNKEVALISQATFCLFRATLTVQQSELVSKVHPTVAVVLSTLVLGLLDSVGFVAKPFSVSKR